MIKVLIAMRRVAVILALLAALVGPSAAQNFVPGFEDRPNKGRSKAQEWPEEVDHYFVSRL